MGVQHFYKANNDMLIRLEGTICMSANLYFVSNFILYIKDIQLSIFWSFTLFWQEWPDVMAKLTTYLENIRSLAIIDKTNYFNTH